MKSLEEQLRNSMTMPEGIDRLTVHILQSAWQSAFGRLLPYWLHDLRGPLNTLSMQIDLLREGIQHIPGQNEPLLNQIGKSSLKMRDQVNSLQTCLDSSRSKPEPYCLGMLLRQVAQLFRSLCGQQSIQMRVTEEALPMTAGRGAILQALVHLTMNAVEAMPGGGVLEIRIDRRAEDPVVEIRDSGPGIEPAARDRIFDLHFSTKPGHGGLGLPVAGHLIRTVGGQLELMSDASGGVFRIRLQKEPGLQTKSNHDRGSVETLRRE